MKENLKIYGGACIFILILVGLGFIFYKLNWVLMIFLFISPFVTFLMKVALKNKIDKEASDIISHVVLYILCVGILCLLMTYKSCRTELVNLFAVENGDWKFSAIEIFLFVIMLVFPYFSFKFSTEINSLPLKKPSH